MSKVVDLFGYSTHQISLDWPRIVDSRQCAYTNRQCHKTRKSQPEIAIGTCTVLHGKNSDPVVICPNRLLERRQIFIDCLHLLTKHEPGNELHVVPEVAIPGGSVDFFLVSARDGRVQDFVGIEMQALDTVGSVWPERQRLLKKLNVDRLDEEENSIKAFGINWKMTAKTILMQIHHKVRTFEHVEKKLVLVIQDRLLEYMSREFRFDHLHSPAVIRDSMHLHAYRMDQLSTGGFKLSLASRISTDANGAESCLDLQAEARVDLELMVTALQAKISDSTIFIPV